MHLSTFCEIKSKVIVMNLKRNPTTIVSFLLLGLAILEPIINSAINFASFEQSTQTMLGLLSAGLITYIIAESEREKRYQQQILDVLFGVRHIEDKLNPFRTVTLEERYKVGTEIARLAKKRLYLFAGSLILLTGPKPYLSDEPIDYEMEQYMLFSQIAERAAKGNEPKFFCSFLPSRLRTEVARMSHDTKSKKYFEFVSQKIQWAKALEQGENSLFHLRQARANYNPYFVFMVGDDHFALWLKNAITKGHDLLIRGVDRHIADNLAWLFMEITDTVDHDNLIRSLENALEGLEDI